jgi:hypothetical protein
MFICLRGTNGSPLTKGYLFSIIFFICILYTLMSLVDAILNELSIGNLFVRPNLLLWNRPEVFVFTTEKRIFILESGSGGIYGHAHGLTQLKNPRKLPEKINIL